jgi:hypothetical protein
MNIQAVVLSEDDDDQLMEEFQPLDQEVDAILEQEETSTELVFVEDLTENVKEENKTEEDNDLDWLNF